MIAVTSTRPSDPDLSPTLLPTDVSAWTVADLLAGVGRRDTRAWTELVRRFEGLLVRRARRYHLQEADLLDVVQTTWQRLAENWHTVEQPERLGGWLATTVSRECLRLVKRQRTCVPEADVAATLVDPGLGPEERALRTEVATSVRELVAVLPARRQAVVMALFSDERPSYAEIATRVGVPIGSIGPTRLRCLSHLRALAEARELATA